MKLKTEEPDPFDCFETIPELLAFCYRKYGAEDVRYMLQQAQLGREKLESYAAEFGKVGLPKLAALVRAAST
jgi:hypothetical protein